MRLSTKTTPRVDEQKLIVCIYCGKPQQVGVRAMSLPCRFCSKSLKVEDLVIAGYEARRALETCGAVTIDLKGNAIVTRVVCSALVIRGKLKGNVLCRGPVVIEPTGDVHGDVTAPSISIAAGARLEGKCDIGRPVEPWT